MDRDNDSSNESIERGVEDGGDDIDDVWGCPGIYFWAGTGMFTTFKPGSQFSLYMYADDDSGGGDAGDVTDDGWRAHACSEYRSGGGRGRGVPR